MSRSIFGLMAALLLGGTAFAANANSGNLHLQSAVTIQGKQLKAGEYRVQWNSTGSTVELNITDAKKNAITVTAHVVPVSEKNQGDGHTTRNQDGMSALTQIFFRGKNYELHLDDEAAMTPAPAGDSN